RQHDGERRFEFAVAPNAEPERGTAKNSRISQVGACNVFDNPRRAGGFEKATNTVNHLAALDGGQTFETGIVLTRRAGVNGVEAGHEIRIERKAVRLNELERIIGLRLDIDAHN